jgi:hypothetical protein
VYYVTIITYQTNRHVDIIIEDSVSKVNQSASEAQQGNCIESIEYQ